MSVSFVSRRAMGFRNNGSTNLDLPPGFSLNVDLTYAQQSFVGPGEVAYLPAGVTVTLDDSSWILSSPEYAQGISGVSETFLCSASATPITTDPAFITVLSSS
jgi:hypothetical protein